MRLIVLLFLFTLASCSKVKLESCQAWGEKGITNTPFCKMSVFSKHDVEYDEDGYVKEDNIISPNEIRVVLLGSHSVSGEMVDENNRLSSELEKLFNVGKKKYRFINLGVRGSGMAFYSTNFEYILHKYKPNLIFTVIEPKVLVSDYFLGQSSVGICPLKLAIDFNTSSAAEKVSLKTITHLIDIKTKAADKKIATYNFWTFGNVRLNDFLSGTMGCSFLKAFVNNSTIRTSDFELLIYLRKYPVIISSDFQAAFLDARDFKGNGIDKSKLYYALLAKAIHSEFNKHNSL